MKKLNLLLIGGMLMLSTVMNAQKWAIDKTLSFMKGQKEINIQFTYDGMLVGNAGREEDYVNEKKAELNKKEPGKGDKWAQAWVDNRERVFHPKFEELFNSRAGKVGIIGGRSKSNAKYTMIVHTLSTEPGFNVGVMKRPAFCNYEITIVETANPGTPLARTSLASVIGSQAMGFDYDVASRVGESYAKAGKMIGKSMAKLLKP